MKTYVERNIEKRKQARNSFEKDFWKLANNSVFGKTCENVMNRVDVRLVNEQKKALRQILKPNYKQHTIYLVLPGPAGAVPEGRQTSHPRGRDSHLTDRSLEDRKSSVRDRKKNGV